MIKIRKGVVISIIVVMTVLFTSTISFASSWSKPKHYGKYCGRDYYYVTKTYPVFRIDKNGTKPSKKTLNKWIDALIDVGVSFASLKVSIPYTVVKSAMGISKSDSYKISHGSYFTHTYQVKKTTRRFFAYTNKNKTNRRYVYLDETGIADKFHTFRPVGLKHKKSAYDVKKAYGVKLKTRNCRDKQTILKRCHVNYNHKGEEVWRITTELLFENWK